MSAAIPVPGRTGAPNDANARRRSAVERLKTLRVAYAPISPNLRAAGDRRRFCYYAAARDLAFEVADPAKEHDVVVVSQRGDLTAWARYRPTRARILYDLVDSYLAIPRFEPKALLRGTAKFALRETRRFAPSYRSAMLAMCRRADAVVCSTEEQRQQILAACPNVHVILDVHRSLARERKTDFRAGTPVNLVWEGVPQTISGFRAIAEVLRDVSSERDVLLHLITDLRYGRFLGRYMSAQTDRLIDKTVGPAHLYQWNEALLAKIACACDIAIIPLDLEDPLARGKPENKLLLFWRLGLPTIASATPANTRAMRAAGVDLACGDPEAWRAALRRCIDSESVRRTAAERGHTYQQSHHADDAVLERWDDLFASVLL